MSRLTADGFLIVLVLFLTLASVLFFIGVVVDLEDRVEALELVQPEHTPSEEK